MTISEMDADLSNYKTLDTLSNRVPYWERRFNLTKHSADDSDAFDEVVAKHYRRVLGVLRAG